MKPPAHPPGPTRSLASRLARPLVAAVVLVWSISTALVAWYVDTQIQHNFDTELVESAHRQLYPALLDAATPEPAQAQAQAQAQAVRILGEVPGSDYTEPLSLQLRNAQGRLLLRSRAAPEEAFAAPLQEGFYDTAQHRIYTLEEPESGVWLQLADPLDERTEARWRTASGLIAVLLLMLPVLLWLIHWIARRELHSLRWLQAHAGLDLFVSPRPHWTAILGFGAIAVALAMRIHRDHFPHAAKRLLISGALLLSVGPLLWVHAFFEPKISLRVLDVGQGQAVLLEWPYGGRAMVDGGGLFSDRFDVGRDLVSLVLTANNLPRLDFIAVTHPDRDHLKGLLFIAANYAMKAAYTAPLEGIDTPQHGSPRPLSEAFTAILASRGIPHHTLGAGNVLPLADGLALEVLAPAPRRDGE